MLSTRGNFNRVWRRQGAFGGYFSSPVGARGRLYFGPGEALLTVVEPGDRLNVLARNDFGEPISATPAMSPEGIGSCAAATRAG
jgi:hypothetical protein